MTDAQIFEWLAEQPFTREEIGDLLGYKKRTVDNWYSDKELPDPARQHLIRIINESQHPGNLRFTLSQWDSIESARIASGYKDRTEFFAAALTDYARRHSTAADKATPIPFPADSLRVAEDPAEYITTPRSKAVPALSPRPRSTPNPPKNTP